MTQKDSINNKISAIKMYSNYLSQLSHYTNADLLNSIEARGAIERYVYLLAQATIDLAEMIIAYKNLRKPQSMSESFQILLENKIIDSNLESNLVKMVGMRNILAHAYQKVEVTYLTEVMKKSKYDIEVFIKVVENSI